MNTWQELWRHVKFYWHADSRPLALLVAFMFIYLASALIALLVRDWLPVFISLLAMPFLPWLFFPAPDDAERQRVLPCAEFMLSQPVSRRCLYYARLLLVSLYLLPCVLLCSAAAVWQPDRQLSTRMVNEEQLDAYRQHFPGTTLSASGNTVRVPRGNLCEAGLLASAGVVLWLAAQSFLLLPLSTKFFQYAPTAMLVTYMIGAPVLRYQPLGEAWNLLLFSFADWWWLVMLSLSAAAALVQWLVCWRLKNLQIA